LTDLQAKFESQQDLQKLANELSDGKIEGLEKQI